MPGRNRLEKRKDKYSELIGYLEENSKKYKKLLDGMRTLNAKINEFSELSADEFDVEKKKELIGYYKDVLRSVDEYINKEYSKTNPDIEVLGMFYYRRKMLSKDYSTLVGNLKEQKPSTLNDIFEDSRSTTLKLDRKLKSLGYSAGNQNERYKLTIKTDNNGDVTGYFAEDKRVLRGTEEGRFMLACQDDIVEKYSLIGEYNEDLFDVAHRLLENPFIMDMLCTEEDYNRTLVDGRAKTMNELKKACTYKDKTDKQALRLVNSLKDLDNLHFRAIIDYMHMIAKPMMERNTKNGLGINATARGNRRNSAMSAVSEMLGCSQVLAHSESLKIEEKNDDPYDLNRQGPIKGTFMEEVKGEDVQKSDEKSELYKANLSYIEGCDGLVKNIANLQIMDYLCGNPDRHYANVIYKIENGKLISVTGIDNDTSFGSKDHTKVMAGVSLEKLTVIPEDMAKRVLDLDEESFKFMLYGHDIDSLEAQNAVDRLRKLKTKIIKDQKDYEYTIEGYLIPGKLKVCDDDELNSLSIHSQLASKSIDKNGNEVIDNKNLFSYLTNPFLTGKGTRNVLNNYKKEVCEDIAGLCTKDVTELIDDYDCFAKTNILNHFDTKKFVAEFRKKEKLLKENPEENSAKERMQEEFNNLNNQFVYTLKETGNALMLLKGEMKFVGVKKIKDSDEITQIKISAQMETLKTHVENGLKGIKELLKAHGASIKTEESRKYLNDLAEHLENMKVKLDRIEQNVGKMDTVIKEAAKIDEENEKINEQVESQAKKKNEEIRLIQLRVDMNQYLEPIEEEVAFSKYEMDDLQKKLETETDPKKKEVLETGLEEKKLLYNLNRLSRDASYGLIKIITQPEKYKEDDTFKRGLAAGLIRYKLDLMKNPKKRSADEKKIGLLKGIPTDIKDYDRCLDTLMNDKQFQKTAEALTPANFSKEDVEKIAKGDIKGCFEKVANVFAAPVKEPEGPVLK